MRVYAERYPLGRAAAAISRFYVNCKKKVPGKKGYPKFKKHSRSVEYKTTGWKLSDNRKKITFTDKNNIGQVKLKGTRDLNWYNIKQIKRVRIVRRADGYYCQFIVDADNREQTEPTYSEIGLDVGLNYFYTDDKGNQVENPNFYRKGEKALKRLNKTKSRKYVKGAKQQSNNYHKARKKYAIKHLKISRQRKDHAVKLARCVVTSNDVVAYENLRIANMVQNHNLAQRVRADRRRERKAFRSATQTLGHSPRTTGEALLPARSLMQAGISLGNG